MGGTGGLYPSTLTNDKNIGFSSNTGPDPLKNCKATKTAFNIGPSLAPVIGTPFNAVLLAG